jgi:hypothetical protein
MNPSNNIYKPGRAAMMNGTGNPGLNDDAPEPFPVDCLPPAAADMARAIVHTERTPMTLAGCCVLGFISASIGAGLEVISGPNRTSRANLFIAGGGESASGKSETFRHAARPFLTYESDLLERWKAETQPGLQAEADLLESEIKKLTTAKGKNKSGFEREELRAELQTKKKALADVKEKLNCPRLCCEDVTSEKLAVMLAHNQEQLFSVSPDARVIVDILLGKYTKEKGTDEGIYLKAWSGDNCRVDRQGRDSILLQRPCLAALWLVQPDKIETLLGERSLTDGGMIPRLLVCQTQAQALPIVDGVEGIPADVAGAWAKLVIVLLKTFRFASAPITIEPTPKAREAMKVHFNSIVTRRLTDLRDVNTFAGRWNEQAWRIALCIHAGLHGADAGDGRKMDLDTAQRGIRLADWFAGEQLRILAGGRHAAKRVKRDEVLALLADKPAGITARDVQRAVHLPSADEARALLADMGAEGELTHTESKPENGGHVTLIYTKARK